MKLKKLDSINLLFYKKFVHAFSLVIFSTLLASCSLRAYYSIQNPNSNFQELSKIESVVSQGVHESEYHDILVSYLNPSGKSEYSLYTDLTFSKELSILQPNSDVIREDAVIQVKYRLVRKSDSEQLTSGSFRRNISYSTAFAPYANQAHADDSTSQLAQSAACEVHNRMMMYFFESSNSQSTNSVKN